VEDKVVSALVERTRNEGFSRLLGMEVVEAAPGRAVARMQVDQRHTNVFGMVHGGAIFSLLDEAFQVACNAHGQIAVALQVSVNYLAPVRPGVSLGAELTELNRTRRTGLYQARVWSEPGGDVAVGQALAWVVGRALPFVEE